VGKNLVIVESPGKIKTLGRVLGRDFIIKASRGHVRDLPGNRKDDNLQNPLVVGVAKDFTPSYVTMPSKKKYLDEIKRSVEGVDMVYLCPDPDREGEAIAWHLAEALKLSPAQAVRVTFDEITPRGIRAGFASPRGIDMDLVNSQQARRILDRIVGYTLSPLLTQKIGGGHLTAGRVQSVAVRLLVEREKEIKAFKSEAYWTISAKFSLADKGLPFGASLRALDGKQVVANGDDLAKFKSGQAQLGASGVVRILIANAAEAHALVAALRTASYAVSFYEVKEVFDRPYPPFATSQLQQAAAVRLGFDAKRTMRVAQQLYEGVPLGEQGPVGLITYMRTDSFRISQDALNECRDLIRQRYGEKYLPEKPVFYRSRTGAQEAHESIRPTHVELTPEQIRQHLSDEQHKLYKLIHDRFVACQMAPAVFDATTADIEARGWNLGAPASPPLGAPASSPASAGGAPALPGTASDLPLLGSGPHIAVFRATGRVLKFDGWLAVQGGAAALAAAHIEASTADREKGDETDEAPNGETQAAASAAPKPLESRKPQTEPVQVLPAMKIADRPRLEGLEPEEHFTQPPPRYTEASLVKKLEREGIGRPSTYAAILSRIQQVGYAQKFGSGGRAALGATDIGILVT